jgi:hypothetical protein
LMYHSLASQKNQINKEYAVLEKKYARKVGRLTDAEDKLKVATT